MRKRQREACYVFGHPSWAINIYTVILRKRFLLLPRRQLSDGTSLDINHIIARLLQFLVFGTSPNHAWLTGCTCSIYT